MTREELEAALDPARRDFGWLKVLVAAARKQLALMPEKCATCGGRGWGWNVKVRVDCPTCHGSGKVYPPETVGLFRKVVDAWAPDLNEYAKSQFVMELLDALGETE